MGYYMDQQEALFFMDKRYFSRACQAVKNLHGKETHVSHFSWVEKDFYKSRDFVEIMRHWRWDITLDENGHADHIGFNGEKLGDDTIVFRAIAPFVRDGSFIVMRGEDGTVWRWRFDGNKIVEETGRITFD